MSHLLELLGHGLEHDVTDLLDRYFWAPQTRSLAQLQDALSRQPSSAELHVQLGLAYLQALQQDKAVEHLGQACRLKPDDLGARVAFAAAHLDHGQTDKAMEQLKFANQVSPGEVPVLFAIGYCLEKLQRPQAAEEYYADAVARAPSFAPARRRLAAVAVFLGKDELAIEQYQSLRQTYPQDMSVRSALAHLYHRAGRYSDAVMEFESAIAMEPANWALMDDEVESLAADGLTREAIERLHALLEEQGPFADLHVRLGDLYSQSGDDAAAMEHYHSALELQDNYLEALVKLGTQHLVNGRWEQAAESFHQAAELNDRLTVNYIGMGVAQAAAGKKAEAINTFNLAVAVEPNSTLLLSEMARLQLKAAVAEEAIRSFDMDGQVPVAELALDQDNLLARQIERHAEEVASHPQYADLRYRFGVLLRADGRLVEAKEQFTKAVEINPTYIQAIVRLGIAQQELGQLDEAIETFKHVLDIKPQFVDLHYRLGLLYTDRKEFEEAVRHMEAAAEAAPNNGQVRAGLALSLQNMGLMDRAAATWRSLWKIHHAKT